MNPVVTKLLRLTYTLSAVGKTGIDKYPLKDVAGVCFIPDARSFGLRITISKTRSRTVVLLRIVSIEQKPYGQSDPFVWVGGGGCGVVAVGLISWPHVRTVGMFFFLLSRHF